MYIGNTRQISARIGTFIFAALVALLLATGSGVAAEEIRPASAAENQIVKLGHRYFTDESQAVQVQVTYPENHRIGQRN